MPKQLGFSLYLSTCEKQWPTLEKWAGTGAPVFLSLHISEEFDETYCQRAQAACRRLAGMGFRIIADVSVKTVAQFGEPDISRLANRLSIWAARIDYGFSEEEIRELAEKMPIVLNASTTTPEAATRIAQWGMEICAMHNFYPRPETGLDREFLLESTRQLQEAGLKVLAFIPGDEALRGPLFEKLPTLEEHRSCLPSAAFVDLAQNFGMDEIFLADPGLSETEQQRIARFCADGTISVPAELAQGYEKLYGQVFTCRVDSPKWIVRFTESRTYSCFGTAVEPVNCVRRTRGAITIDNVNYGRYTGEVQMVRQSLPADARVNVIGSVPENGWMLMDCIRRGQKFVLVRP